MNIVIIGTAYPMRGAMAQLNIILANYLSQNHNVEIVSFKRQYPKILFPGKTQIDPSPPLFNIKTTPLIDTINPLTWIKTAKYIIKVNPQIIIFRYWMPFFAPCFGSIIRLIKNKIKTKIIFICDNIIPHEKRIGDKALTLYALSKVDKFIALSKSVERDLLKTLPSANYIYSPLPLIDISKSAIDKNVAKNILGLKDDRVVLFFGFVREYKGLDVLIKALPKVLEKINIKLLVVGEFYQDINYYLKMINELRLQNNVIIKSDYLPNDEIYKYFSASDVVVLPYKSATQSAIVQIAYQYNKPVIVTDVGGLSEVVKDGKTGFVVTPDNSILLADAILKYYKENCESEFSKNIETEKRQYSWSIFVDKLELLMKEN